MAAQGQFDRASVSLFLKQELSGFRLVSFTTIFRCIESGDEFFSEGETSGIITWPVFLHCLSTN